MTPYCSIFINFDPLNLYAYPQFFLKKTFPLIQKDGQGRKRNFDNIWGSKCFFKFFSKKSLFSLVFKRAGNSVIQKLFVRLQIFFSSQPFISVRMGENINLTPKCCPNSVFGPQPSFCISGKVFFKKIRGRHIIVLRNVMSKHSHSCQTGFPIFSDLSKMPFF